MSRGKRRSIAVAVVAICAALAGAMWHQRSGFRVVATHPDAATQPTATGRVIATLASFDGRLYAGYGDYGSNTGPIVIRAFDPVSERFGEPLLRSQTEAIYIFRWIADRLYAPHIDPAGDATAGGFAVGEINAGGRHVWTDRSAVTAVHLFDIN